MLCFLDLGAGYSAVFSLWKDINRFLQILWDSISYFNKNNKNLKIKYNFLLFLTPSHLVPPRSSHCYHFKENIQSLEYIITCLYIRCILLLLLESKFLPYFMRTLFFRAVLGLQKNQVKSITYFIYSLPQQPPSLPTLQKRATVTRDELL